MCRSGIVLDTLAVLFQKLPTRPERLPTTGNNKVVRMPLSEEANGTFRRQRPANTVPPDGTFNAEAHSPLSGPGYRKLSLEPQPPAQSATSCFRSASTSFAFSASGDSNPIISSFYSYISTYFSKYSEVWSAISLSSVPSLHTLSTKHNGRRIWSSILGSKCSVLR